MSDPLVFHRQARVPDVAAPSPREAAAWFVELARERIAAGERLAAEAVHVLIALAPGDPVVAVALEQVELEDPPSSIEPLLDQQAHTAAALLEHAVAARDEAMARAAVSELEAEILRVYRPGRGTGRFEDDVAVAGLMLDAHEVGHDETHVMLAEELMLTVLRRDWPSLPSLPLAAACEAAVVLARLAERVEKPEYHDRALDVMRTFAGTYRNHGLKAAPYISALQVIC